MADVSELLIEVKNINKTLSDIQSVGDKLKQTQQQAASFGKAIFAGWSFTKIIKAAKEFGDAWRDTVTTFRNFDTVFGNFNSQALEGVNELKDAFQETDKGARKLLSTIGSRIDFNLNTTEVTAMSKDLAKLSKEIGSFYGINAEQVSEKLTRGLSGMTKGLKEFGINIDTASPRFKELVNDLMTSTGKTEEAAKAMVIYNEIMKKGQKFKGSFEAQAKTLSQAFENISNSLTDGPFAKAGEILSTIFVPILNKVNDLINIPWVSTIMGIVAALGLVLASVIAIQVAVNGLKGGILKMAASGGISGAVGTLLTSLGGWIKVIFVALGKAILVGVSAVVTFIAGLPAAAIAAIIAVLAAAALLLINKLTTGEWFNFSGMFNAVIGWFKKLGQSVVNWLRGKGFKSDETIDKEAKEKISKFVKSINDITAETSDELNKFFDQVKEKTPVEASQDAAKRLLAITKEYESLTDRFNYFTDLFNRTTDLESKEILGKKLEQLAKDRQKAARAFIEAKMAFDEAKKAEEEYNKKKAEDAKKAAEDAKKAAEEQRKAALKIDQEKFGDFTWYQDAMRKIQDGLGKTLPQDKIKDIDKRIEEFKKTFTHMTPEEQKKAYKEISNMELEKFNLEMEMLNKERDAIAKTNELVEGYVKRAMEWKPSGVEGIQANTMEGYKFLTSSLGSLTDLGPVLQNTQNQQADLQKRANDIAASTKSSVDEIKRKMDSLSNNSTQVNITVVN